MFMAPVIHSVANPSVHDVVRYLGLATDLTFIIDAGDRESVADASAQALLALPSGGPIWTRGNSGSGDTRDPTFNGNIGALSSSEYWAHVAGSPTQYFESPKAAWSAAMHKNNAKFTMAFWYYAPSGMDGVNFFATQGGAGDVGVSVGFTDNDYSGGANRPFLLCERGNVSTTALLEVVTSLTGTRNTIAFIAFSYDEASGNLIVQSQASQATASGTYSSPSSADSTINPVAGVFDAGGGGTARLYSMAHWGRALSGAELTSYYNGTKGRFGL